MWRKKVTYYLHSRNPDMASLLRWAELQKDTITPDGLRQARANDPSLAGLQDDPEVLSYHLWGFLNASLVGEAWMKFDATEMENGLEVWRSVNEDTTQKTQAELLVLEDAVSAPRQCAHIKDIQQALVEWDAAYRTFVEAGGRQFDDHRKFGILMRMLPQEVKQQAMWSCDKFDGKPLELRRWIRERTQWMKWGDTTQKGKHHLLDGGSGDDASATALEDALGPCPMGSWRPSYVADLAVPRRSRQGIGVLKAVESVSLLVSLLAARKI